jgi:hypothetical protein
MKLDKTIKVVTVDQDGRPRGIKNQEIDLLRCHCV